MPLTLFPCPKSHFSVPPQDAGIPSGPTLQILYYLEFSQKIRSRHSSQFSGFRVSNPNTPSPTIPQAQQYLNYFPSRSDTPNFTSLITV